MDYRSLGRTGMQVSPVVLDGDVLDAIDEIVPPGTTLADIDRGYVPPALQDPFLRRRRTA